MVGRHVVPTHLPRTPQLPHFISHLLHLLAPDQVHDVARESRVLHSSALGAQAAVPIRQTLRLALLGPRIRQ